MSGNIFALILAILLRIFSNPIANVFQKKLTVNGLSAILVNFLTYLILALICLVLSLKLDWEQIPKEFWAYSALMGLLGAMGNLYLVKALHVGDLSVLGPINAYKAVVSMIIGFFVLLEIPSAIGLAGVGLIIFGSYFVLNTTAEGFTWGLFKRKEIQFRIWAMILTATEAIFVKKVILASSVTHCFVSWCWFGALFSFILVLVNKIQFKTQFRKVKISNLSNFLWLVICIGVSQFSTGFVFDRMPVGYALSLFQLSVLVNIFLGYRIFKEGDVVKKLIGAVIMMAGSVLIILY